MYKKIIGMVGILGVLATQCLANSGTDEQRLFSCNAINNLSKQISVIDIEGTCGNLQNKADIGLCKQLQLKTNAELRGDFYTNKYGALSTDLLKDLGLGVSVNMNWTTVFAKFNEFDLSLTEKDKYEIAKFLLYADRNLDITEFSDSIYSYFANVQQYRKEQNLPTAVFTADALGFGSKNHIKDRNTIKPFFKYVMNGDFVKAKAYASSINKKYNVEKDIQYLINFCKE